MDAIYDAIVGASTIKQVRRTSFNPNVKLQALRQSGAVDPSQLVITAGEPRATFESFDVGGVLTALGVSSGLFVSAGTITIPWNRRANGGTFAGNLSCMTLTGANGMAVLNSISAAQGDEGAVADVELCFLSTDGLTAPVTAAVNQTLSAEAFDAGWALGPVYINGAELTQVVNVRVNTGIALVVKAYSGQIYPILAFIQARDPTIDITFENLDAVQANGPLFASLTSPFVYFRKKVDKGTFAVDNVGNHIKLGFATGVSTIGAVDAHGNANAQATLRFTGNTLTSSTASTVP